jgi:hypothetical protein
MADSARSSESSSGGVNWPDAILAHSKRSKETACLAAGLQEKTAGSRRHSSLPQRKEDDVDTGPFRVIR